MILYNSSAKSFVIEPGHKIAQLVFLKYFVPDEPIPPVCKTPRADRGLGALENAE